MNVNEELLDKFLYWMEERHRIYVSYKIEGRKPPFSKDPIFNEWKFTNVFRELDTGTIWLRENFIEPFEDDEHLFFNICAYRSFNWWPTSLYMGYQVAEDSFSEYSNDDDFIYIWNPTQLEQDLNDRQFHDGEQIFTNAHMLTGTLGGPERKNKIWQVVWQVLDSLWKTQDKYNPEVTGERTLEGFFKKMKDATGFGPFIAYEVTTDLRHTRYLQAAPDILTWANPGPGAMRGINRLLNLPVGRYKDGSTTKYHPVKVSGLDYVQNMRDLLAIALEELPNNDDYHIAFYELEMRDIEHSLCEFDKYMRVQTGEGYPRQRFNPKL